MKLKSILASALAIVALVATVHADEVTTTFTTSATITPAGTPLTFIGVTETETTPSMDLNIGTFFAGTSPDGAFTGAFTLTVVFAAPTPILGGQTADFQAILDGRFTSRGNGNIEVEFLNPSQTFPFGSPFSTMGSFTFTVADFTTVPEGGQATLFASITGSQTTVPDGGATVALLGVAMMGMVAVRRKLGLA